MNLVSEVRKKILKDRLFKKGDKVLLGVSGGPDSTALTYILNSIKKEFGLSLHIAHLNHILRGKESDNDAEFTKRLAKKLDIPFTLKEEALPKGVSSVEEEARKIRFNFLFSTASKIKADKIALGHNRSDQAETVLMRLLRGSGLLGLSGILPKRQIYGWTVVRPLIDTERGEIERFLKLKKIKPCRDSSNFRKIYFRNNLRLGLLPVLEKYQPGISGILANTAQNISLDYDYLLASAERAFKNLKSGDIKTGIKLPLLRLLKIHPAMRNMVFRLVFRELTGYTRRITYQHIKELNALVFDRPVGSIVDLPSSISVRKNKIYLIAYNPGICIGK